MHKDDLITSGIKEGIQEIKRTPEKCFTYEFPFYTLKNCFWFMFVACLVKDAESGNVFIITKYYDITDHHNRRKHENKLEDNNIVRQIIGESMHTWRQPLNNISLFVQDIKEQFTDSTLTEDSMNFSSTQIVSEIGRLSESIDEMAEFYNNDTLEDTINISEALFRNIHKVDHIIKESKITVGVDCHALGNVDNAKFVNITDRFRIKCGTGTKLCFKSGNRGNLLVYGDKVLFNYLIRMIIGLTKDIQTEEAKYIHFDLSIKNNKFTVAATINHNPDKPETLEFLKSLFEQNFKGTCLISETDDEVQIEMRFQ
ncbi:MAG: hypothetical protein C0602_11155 [Denitrovibrio sp.]|nr:MAG: hypothetical protein C0602_11155 [Denitrovibrio sp.]